MTPDKEYIRIEGATHYDQNQPSRLHQRITAVLDWSRRKGLTLLPHNAFMKTAAAISAPAEWFERWWNPQALLEDALARMDAIPRSLRFTCELKPFSEACAAAKFATIRGQARPCDVRLVLVDPAAVFPDFKIRLDGVIEQFEQTEADREGRRRHDEYNEVDQRAAGSETTGLKHYDPDEEMAAAPQAISIALKCKTKKHYRPQPHLLVYVNFPTATADLR